MSLSNEVGRLELSSIIGYSTSHIRDPSHVTSTLGVDAERTPPYYKLKDSLGRYLINDVLAQFNPLGILEQGGSRDYDNDDLTGSLSATVKIVKGLTLRGVFGGTPGANHEHYVTPCLPFYRDGQAVGSAPGGVYGNALGNVTGDQNTKNLFLKSQLLLESMRDLCRHHIPLLW